MLLNEIRQPLNEGIASKFIELTKKVKSTISTLSKYKYKEYVALNKNKINEISKEILDQLVSGKKMTSDQLIATLTKAVKGDKKLQTISESLEHSDELLTEDFQGFIARVLTDLAAIFMAFMAILQGNGVRAAMQKAAESPSVANDIMVKGVTGCLVIIVTGLLAAIALRLVFGMKEKERKKNSY
jgi:F0F1-type ATP synthase membrane subunit c/vacuolar-type H+-ATPase subunit K